MVLSPSEAKTFYDRFGKKQDSQGFYEDPATDDLLAHADFGQAGRVFEFGCGTGRLAEKLLTAHLSATARYTGCDLSSTMVGLATKRLAAYEERAQVIQSDGAIRFPVPDRSVDRVVSAYVLDLLSESDIKAFFLEAHRVLDTGGRVCLVSLTRGTTLLSRLVTGVWQSIFRVRASLVGGCRPIQLSQYLSQILWQLDYHRVVTSFGIPSEVLVAHSKSDR